MSTSLFALAAALFLSAATVGGAQDSTGSRRSALGFLVGVPGEGSDVASALATLGVSWTQIHPRRLGADLSVGTAPWADLVLGAAALGARADVTFPIAAGPSLLVMPAAGVSVLTVGGRDVASGVVGVNGGLAAIVSGSGSLGFRAGVTVHHFREQPGALWLAEVGLVLLR